MIHINTGGRKEIACGVNHCPTCERPRRMLCESWEWYSAVWTCTGCGDDWSEGVRGQRPFCRGWRQASIRRARKVLANIGIQA